MDQHHRIACILPYFDWDWPFPGILCQIQHNEGQLEQYLHQLKWWFPCRFLPPGAETIWPGERRSQRSADEDQISFCISITSTDHSYLFCAAAAVVMYVCMYVEGSSWRGESQSLQSLSGEENSETGKLERWSQRQGPSKASMFQNAITPCHESWQNPSALPIVWSSQKF